MIGASKNIWGFDPRSIPGCTIWLDGADITTFTPANPTSGTTITAWQDKASGFSFTPGAINVQSSNGTVLTPVGPTYVTGGGARFSNLTQAIGTGEQALGIYQAGVSTPLFFVPNQNMTMIIASSATSNNTLRRIARMGTYPSTANPNFLLGPQMGVSEGGSIIFDVGPAQLNYSTSTLTYSTAIGLRVDTMISAPAATQWWWTNGVLNTFTNSNIYTSAFSNYPVNFFFLGAYTNTVDGNRCYLGNIYEVLFYSNALTMPQRQTVEGYLANKWGFKASLPATSPFTLYPPLARYFTPTDIPGCSLWFDGADNLTMNSTTTVTSWSDKSGLGNHMAGNATWTGSNLTFNGSTQAFSNLAYVFPNSAYSMFAVYSNTTAPASTAYMNVVYGSSGYPMLGVYDVNKYVSARSVVANTGALSLLIPASSNVLVSATYAPTTMSPFVNGIPATTLAGTTLATTGIFVGGPTNYFNGSISELLIYGATLSVAQRRQVEGYLTNKWRLNSQIVTGHPYKLIPPATPQPAQYAEVTPGNWTRDWQPYLKSLAAANASGVTFGATSTLGGGGGYGAGVLALDGKIYASPFQFSPVISNVLVFTVSTGTTTTIAGTATYVGNGWCGGCLAPNGNIYYCPNTAFNILVVNPVAGTTSNLGGGAVYSSGGWSGGVLAPNGNIYFAPNNATNILVLNTVTRTTSNLTGGATYTANGWCGGCLGQDGNIYFAPFNATNVLVLNPTTGVTSNLTGGATYTTDGWSGGVLAPNGNIYFAPNNATNILVLNTVTRTTSNLTGGATYTARAGGVLAPNGNIYFTPGYATTGIIQLNPTTNITSNVSGSTTGSALVNGGNTLLGTDGNMYIFGTQTAGVKKVAITGLSQLPASNYCLSAYANKF